MASPFKTNASLSRRRPQPVNLPLDDDEDSRAQTKRPVLGTKGGRERVTPTAQERRKKRDLDRLVQEEDEERRAEEESSKRKASSSRELDLVNPKASGKLTKAQARNLVAPPDSVSDDTVKALRSRFGKRADAIIDMLDQGETDGAITTVQRTLLQTLVDVIPITEHAVRASNGRYGVYQFNQTISQVRELLNDLQATRDKGLLGQSIVDRCVRPSFLDIAGQIVLAFTALNEAAAARMSAADAREFRAQSETMKKNLADYLMAQYHSVSDAVVSSLS